VPAVAGDDDDWGHGPLPMTAVAVRIEEEAVAAVRDLAAAEGVTPSVLMRRWVLERLAAEHERPPTAAPRKKPPAAKKKSAATKKAASRKKAAKKR
jgi:hypothetical protein